jgi:uncharacterized membrane protein
MGQEGQVPRTDDKAEGGTGRLKAFSDGVFALAITLLVLDLKIPALIRVTPTALADALAYMWPSYLTLIFSFITILIMWVYHHRLFQSVQTAGTALLFTNGVLLLLVTLVPFPTGLLGNYLTTPAAPVACAAYAGFFVLIDSAYSLLWWVVYRQETGGRVRRARLPKGMAISFLGIPCFIIAAAVALRVPLLSLGICAALWAVWAITARTPHLPQGRSA